MCDCLVALPPATGEPFALFAKNSDRPAVEVITGLLERYGQGGTGHDPQGATGSKAYWSSFLVADPAEAWVIETSGQQWAVERVVAARASLPGSVCELRHL